MLLLLGLWRCQHFIDFAFVCQFLHIHLSAFQHRMKCRVWSLFKAMPVIPLLVLQDGKGSLLLHRRLHQSKLLYKCSFIEKILNSSSALCVFQHSQLLIFKVVNCQKWRLGSASRHFALSGGTQIVQANLYICGKRIAPFLASSFVQFNITN